MKLDNINKFTCSNNILDYQSSKTTNLSQYDVQFQKACDDKDFDKLTELNEEHLSKIHIDTINTRLLEGAQNNENELVKFLLTNKIGDLNAREPKSKKNLLHIACKKVNLELVEVLLSLGINPNKRDSNDLFPLYYAISSNSYEIAKVLIQYHADATSRALIHLVFNVQNPGILDLLLSNGGDLHCFERNFLLNILCTNKPENTSVEDRKKLLDRLKGHDLLDISPDCQSTLEAIQNACFFDCADVIEYLHENGFDFSKLPEQFVAILLCISIQQRSTKSLKKLLDIGLDCNSKEVSGLTPLYMAVSHKNYDAVHLLCKQGAKKDIRNTINNLTPFEAALTFDDEILIHELIQDGDFAKSYQLNAPCKNPPLCKNLRFLLDEKFIDSLELQLFLLKVDLPQYNRFFLELLKTYPEDKSILIEAGISDLAQKLHQKKVSLEFEIACEEKDFETLERLSQEQTSDILPQTLTKCAFTALKTKENDLVEFFLMNSLVDANEKESPELDSLLHIACQTNNMEIAKLLLQLGADIEIQGRNQVPPLASAISSSSFETFNLLLDHGADTSSKTFVEIAILCQNSKALRALMSRGATLDFKTSYEGVTLLTFLCLYPSNNLQPLCEPSTIGPESRREILDILHAHGKLQFDFLSKEFSITLSTIATSGYVDVLDYLLNNCFELSSLPQEILEGFFNMFMDGNHPDIIKFLIDSGFDVNYQFKDKTTLLHLACKNNDKEAVEMLLRKKAHVNTKDEDGFTPIDIALHHALCNPKIIQMFLEEKEIVASYTLNIHPIVSPSLQGLSYILESPLFEKNKSDFLILLSAKAQEPEFHALMARYLDKYPKCEKELQKAEVLKNFLMCGEFAIIKQIVEEGIISLPTGDNEASTPLHWACCSGNIDLLKWLIDTQKFDINAKNAFGNTILHFASSLMISPKVIDFLAERNFNFFETNNEGNTVFEFALKNEKATVEYLEKLLSYDQDLNFLKAGNKLGRSPLHYAAKMYNEKAIALLIEKYNCDVNVQDELGRTPLMILLRKPESQITPILKLFLKHGANLALKDIRGNTAFHYAFGRNSHREDIQKLLCKKASHLLIEKNNIGTTPLHLACKKHTISQLKELFIHVEEKIDISSFVNDEGKNLLHFAAENKDVKVFEFLIKKGIDFRAATIYREQPIHIALQKKRIELANQLLELGVDPTSILQDGTSCIDIAIMKKLESLFDPLIEKGAILFHSKESHTIPSDFIKEFIPQRLQTLFLQKAYKIACEDTTVSLEEIETNPQILLEHLPIEKVLEFLWYAQNKEFVSKIIPSVNKKEFEKGLEKFSSKVSHDNLRDFFIFDEINPNHFASDEIPKNIPEWTDQSVTIEDLGTIISELEFEDAKHPNYIPHSLMTVHGKTHTTKDLFAYYNNVFIPRIVKEEEFTLTPPKSSDAIKAFYQQLRNSVLPLVSKLKALSTSFEDKRLKMNILLTILPEISLCGPKWQIICKKAYIQFYLGQTPGYKFSALQTLQDMRENIVDSLVNPSNQHNVHEAIAMRKLFGQKLGLLEIDFSDEMAEDMEINKKELLHKFFKAYTVENAIDLCFQKAKDRQEDTYNEIIDILYYNFIDNVKVPEGVDDEIDYLTKYWTEESHEDISSEINKKRVFFKRETIAQVLEYFGIIRRIRPKE